MSTGTSTSHSIRLSQMDRWVGKVALVTGASAGIGASTVEELAKNGMKVVGLARRVERVEDIKKKLGKVKGELFPLKGDVSKEEDILATFKWIKEKFGTIHVLVNNAGIVRDGSLSEGKIELFKEVINTNVLGLTICTQEALKLMKAAGVDDGHIIHINSVTGHYVPNVGNPTVNVYPASKYAVTALTETLRQELNFHKSHIRVTSISPGFVRTEIMDATAKGSGKDLDPGMKQLVSTLPALEPKDVADSVVYALSTPPRVQIHELTIRPVGEPF